MKSTLDLVVVAELGWHCLYWLWPRLQRKGNGSRAHGIRSGSPGDEGRASRVDNHLSSDGIINTATPKRGV